MSEYINNPVYKLLTDNLQLVLIRSIFEHQNFKTCLRCDGIFNNRCFTQSLLRPIKNFENRSTSAEVTGKNQV